MTVTERAGRTLRPTAAGQAYVPYAADVLGLLDQGARLAHEAARQEPPVLRISAVTTASVEEFLAGRGIEPTLLTLGSNGAIKQAARAGLGVALQSEAAVDPELELGLLGTISPGGGSPSAAGTSSAPRLGRCLKTWKAFMAFCSSPAARHALARPAR